jgi:AbrB family looped-hinge helix DNA binding protein
MLKTKISSKGQVVVPLSIRERRNLKTGQTLLVDEVPEGILLRDKPAFARTTLGQVAGCLQYSGPAVSLEDMRAAGAEGALERFEKSVK